MLVLEHCLHSAKCSGESVCTDSTTLFPCHVGRSPLLKLGCAKFWAGSNKSPHSRYFSGLICRIVSTQKRFHFPTDHETKMALSMVSLQRPLRSSCCGKNRARNPRPCQLTWPPIMGSSSWQAFGYSSPQIPSELAGGDSFYLQYSEETDDNKNS